ncbi:MAG: hypothetical protein M1821_003587 [Bathelium mastoideum]|nr:MAG: hypothetical protein M1821_003587 [Bathelium mastoideum]KAI9684875.1 MAG: hypothetical protein M1822_005524 [Bathelium mastoideum]
MAAPITQDVVIIGAGLAGLTLALSLHAEGIPCSVYDLRVPTRRAGGALMLAPNALRVLDSLDLYADLKPQGWNFERLDFKTEDLQTVGSYDFGIPTKHGYHALRIYRDVLLRSVIAAAEGRGIPVHHGYRFSHVISESADEGRVTFAFADGTTRTCSLLVGADGIHSAVRSYLAPDVQPTYSGLCALVGAVDRNIVTFPPGAEADFAQAVTIQGAPGAMVLAPQTAAGNEYMLGTQRAFDERDAAGWKALMGDKDAVMALMRRGEEGWRSELVRSALKGVKRETVYIWPFYVIPKLEAWSSTPGRVVILGDAAHAIPPTVGQGATQSLEDAYSLATLMTRVSEESDWRGALNWWQGMRQERIDRVLDLTTRLNNARATKEEREKLPADKLWQSEGGEDMEWLYNYRVKETVVDWMEGKEKDEKMKAEPQ